MFHAGPGPCVAGEQLDQASLLTALTVFLLSAGPDVCGVEPLHSLCLQRFTSSLEAKEPLVSAAATSSLSDTATGGSFQFSFY